MDNQKLGCVLPMLGDCSDASKEELNKMLDGKLEKLQTEMNKEFSKLKEITRDNGHKLEMLMDFAKQGN